MKKKVAILQSNYIPWKGYFDLINLVDEFILYDDVQYTRRDWRNRNRIKTANGSAWLTIPVEVKDKFKQKIKDTKISDRDWGQKHWKTIVQNYSRANFFNEYKEILEPLFRDSKEIFLSHINHKFLTELNRILGISTKITWSMDYAASGGKAERIVNLCEEAGGKEYLSGPKAKAYLVDDLFRQRGITLTYMDYSGYKEYDQFFPPFDHQVSIIDLLFHLGPKAQKFMKSF
jgi:hypothetical protein